MSIDPQLLVRFVLGCKFQHVHVSFQTKPRREALHEPCQRGRGGQDSHQWQYSRNSTDLFEVPPRAPTHARAEARRRGSLTPAVARCAQVWRGRVPAEQCRWQVRRDLGKLPASGCPQQDGKCAIATGCRLAMDAVRESRHWWHAASHQPALLWPR